MCVLIESASDLESNFAPARRRSAVPALRKQALAKTPGLLSTFGLGLMARSLTPDQMPETSPQPNTVLSRQALFRH